MDKEKSKTSSTWLSSGIGLVSILAIVAGFFVNDSIEAQASSEQAYSSQLYLGFLVAVALANTTVFIRKRGTVVTALSLLTVVVFFIYTLLSISIRITF